MFNIVQKNQKFVKAIMITVTATFVIWGVGNYLSMGSDDGYIAKVGNHKIYMRDIDNIVEQNPKQTDKLQILYGLINQQLLVDNLEHFHLQATNTQLQQAIAAIPAFQESSGAFSLSKYQAFLNNRFITAAQFQHDIAQQIVLEQFLAMLKQSYFSSALFNQRLVQLLGHERDISSYTIDPSQFYDKIQITNTQINDYYNTHIKEFTLAPRAKVEYVILNAATIATNNPKIIKKHDLDELLRKQLTELGDLSYNDPHTLTTTANKLNLKIYNSESWVIQGTIFGEFANPKIQQAIFNTDVVDNHDNSEVVDLGNGNYAVYRVTDYKKEQIQPLATVQNQVITALKAKTADDMASTQGQQDIAQLQNGKLTLPFTNPQTVTLLGTTANMSPSAVERIFSTSIATLPAYTGTIDAHGAFIIYKISGEHNDAQLNQQNESAVIALEQNNALFNLGTYVGSLRNKYSVSYHIERLNQQQQNQ